MAKRLYSLMLNEEVVHAVDYEAHRLGTNRSALIDRVLAEYFAVPTAQKMINDIFGEIDALLSSSEALKTFFAPDSATLSVKSALSYKYRPTLKYELTLDNSPSDKLGDISVIYRTQSLLLLSQLRDFFRLWTAAEQSLLERNKAEKTDYALYDNRFVRSIVLPKNKNYSAQQIAEALSDYVELLDNSIKAYLNGADDEKIINAYIDYLKNSDLII